MSDTTGKTCTNCGCVHINPVGNTCYLCNAPFNALSQDFPAFTVTVNGIQAKFGLN